VEAEGAVSKSFLLICALALSLSSVASAQDSSIRVRSFDAVLTVHADGSLDVTEELTVRLAGESNEIVRDLSLRADGARESPKKLDVTILAVTDEDGEPFHVEEESRDSGWTRRLRIRVPGDGRIDRQIIIQYRVANAIDFVDAGNRSGALDELRWNVTGSGWDIAIDTVRARVVLPGGAKPTRAAVHTEPRGSAAAEATTVTSGNEVSFALPRGLSPHQAMTIAVGWPSGFIHPPRTSSLWDRIAVVLLWWPLLIPVIVFMVAFRAWDRTGRDPKAKSQVVRYEPVDGSSPAGLAKLVDDRRAPHTRIIAATLVDLAIRGYLRIQETTPSILVALTKDVGAIARSVLRGESGTTDYIIHFVRKRPEWKGLMWHEVRLLEALISAAPGDGETKRDSVRVSMLTNNFYVSVPEIFAAVEFELVAKGYYRKSPGSVKLKWLAYASLPYFAGWLLDSLLDRGFATVFDEVLPERGPLSHDALMIGIILSTLILVFFAAIMPSRTVVGARAREAGLGFKEFLSRVEPITSVEMFERYLPYAIAFGVENNWARAFEGIYVTPPDWYTGPTGEFSATAFGHRISDLSLSAASSMSSRPSSGSIAVGSGWPSTGDR